MVRPKDPRQNSRYSKSHYGTPVVTINVDRSGNNFKQSREQFLRNDHGYRPIQRPLEDEDQFSPSRDEYTYQLVNGRDQEKNVPRINFGSSARTPKYENCFKNVDSDYEEDLKFTKGSSFKTALSNHPLVKQQMKQVEENQSYPDTKNVKINLGTFDKRNSSQRAVQPMMGIRRKESGNNLNNGRHYGRNFEDEDQLYEQSTQDLRRNPNKIKLEQVEPYLEEINDLEEESVKPKTLQIFTPNVNDKNYSTPGHTMEKRKWEPLPQKNQRQNEIEQIQRKIQERRIQKESEEERIYDLEVAKPVMNSKVKSVVNMINKEPKKGKENLKCVMTINDEVKETFPQQSSQNLLIKSTPKSPKTSVNLSTDAFHHQHQDSGDFPPPPPQLVPKDTVEQRKSPEVVQEEEKTGEECLAEEADLLLQFLKSNWQVVQYLGIRIPRDVIDRMNRLPRKIVVLKDASELVKIRKSSRRQTKRLGRRGKTKFNLQKRAIERVASMKSDDIHRIVDEQSTLQRNKKQDERFYSRSLQREESFPERIQFQNPKPQIPQLEKGPSVEQEQIYEDSKWNIIKKGGRFVKKSAAALITRKQSPTPLSKNPSNPQNGNPHKTESRIAAEIQNLKEREDELRRHRVAMGLPTVDDLIGHWKHPDPRMCPLKETRSFNHLRINVNEQQRNWPPIQNGHYAMTKSESFHQFHQQHSNQSSVNGKYLRNGEIPGSVNGQPCWIPNDKIQSYRWRSAAATLVNRRARQRPSLGIHHPSTTTQSNPIKPSVLPGAVPDYQASFFPKETRKSVFERILSSIGARNPR